jgi:phenylpyruvate tautomerase PptA (4-oxalocrotonate tautomerase family)
MPFMRIQTNYVLFDEKKEEILEEMSSLLSEILGKSEDYIMISLSDSVKMRFVRSDKPAMFIELKSIGLDRSACKNFSDKICSFIENRVPVKKERIYIVFSDVERSLWGWNGTTF